MGNGMHKKAPVGASGSVRDGKGDPSTSGLHKMGKTRPNFEEARGKRLAGEGKQKGRK